MANFYWRPGVSGNWISPGNWSDTDGGPSNGAVPTQSDDVFFTSLSGPSCAISGISSCASIDCSTYNGTISGFGSLRLHGSLTFGPGMTVNPQPSTAMQVFSSGTWTMSGKTFPCGIIVAAGCEIVLADDLVFTTNAGLQGAFGMIFYGRLGLPCVLRSDTPGTRRKFTYPLRTTFFNAAERMLPYMHYVTVTDVDAGDGETLWTVNGTISNSVNVKEANAVDYSGVFATN